MQYGVLTERQVAQRCQAEQSRQLRVTKRPESSLVKISKDTQRIWTRYQPRPKYEKCGFINVEMT